MTLFGAVGRERIQKRMWIGLTTVTAIQMYYVRERLAALLSFTILFVVVSVVVFALFLLARTIYQTFVWAEPLAARTSQLARYGGVLTE